ncbi:MAG: hypothetical protein R3B48_03070 [Kofleriaceae bacterium]
MSTYRKATIAKRQRELEQKDRVKERESRRQERRQRIQERASLGRSGPEIVPPETPVFEEAGPRSLAELRATRVDDAAMIDDAEEERRFRDPDEAAEAD